MLMVILDMLKYKTDSYLKKKKDKKNNTYEN